MGQPSRFSPELKERAVRMVQEHAAEHPSQWAAIEALAPRLDCATESLRRWVRQAERDTGQRAGVTRYGCPHRTRSGRARTSITMPRAPSGRLNHRSRV
jgi:transposase-like protein